MIQCCIPFCPRTTDKQLENAEWVCAEHWGMTSRTWRRRFALFRRRGRLELADEMWQRLKAQAVERAAGI